MNREVKAKWLTALRSGEYKQGRNQLRDGNGFCCLGVLCDLHARVGGGEWDGGEWDDEYFYLGSHVTLPWVVVEWAGLPDENPFIDSQARATLAEANDAGRTFNEIADIIEMEL